MIADFTVKQGDSWRGEGQLVHDKTGVGIDLTGITVTSMVRTEDGRWLLLEVTKGDQASAPGSYTIQADTTGWPIGVHEWDVQYRRGATKWSSATWRVGIEKDVTA